MHRLLASLALLALLATPACKKNRPPEVDVGALLSALPGNSGAVLGLDVRALASSRYWELLAASLGQDARDLDGMQAGCGVAPKEAVAALLVSIPGSLDPTGVVVAARTRVDRQTIARCAVAIGADHQVQVRVQDEGKMTAYHQGEGGAEYAAWPDDETVVLVPSSSSDPLMLQEMLAEPDRASGNPTLAALADEVDRGAALWAIADLDPATDLGRELGGMPVADKPIAAYAAIKIEDGLRVRIGFRFGSTEAAATAASMLETQLGALADRNASAGRYLESVAVTAADRDAVISLALPEAQVDELIALLRASLPGLIDAARPSL